MIVLAQKWTADKRVDAIFMIPSDGHCRWEASGGIYDPAAGETVEVLLEEGRSRFIGTGTIQTTLAWALSHLSVWTVAPQECIDLKTFLARFNAFIQQAETNLAALVP